MTGFAADWLDLREAADHAARDGALLAAAAGFLADRPGALVVDLGAGTGSTIRALAPVLAAPVRLRCVDDDPVLLAEIVRRHGADVDTRRHDLAGPLPLPVDGAAMVTASALIDLVSGPWLERLVATAAAGRAAVYAALSYDGVMDFRPPHALDGAVTAAFNRDQRRDKGFGPALGPTAADRLAELLRRAGYRVMAAASPWRLGPAQAALSEALVAGIAAAASGETGAAGAEAWLAARRNGLADADGAVTIGHIDILGLP